MFRALEIELVDTDRKKGSVRDIETSNLVLFSFREIETSNSRSFVSFPRIETLFWSISKHGALEIRAT